MTLFIKYVSTDNGNRVPSPCGGPVPVWLAHSIRLTDQANSPISKARVGQTCRIHVDVDSNEDMYPPSADPLDTDLKVRVQVWVCRPTSAGVGPVTALASSPTDIKSITQTIAPGVTGTTFFEWTPQAGDVPGSATETHLCIGANCFWTNAAGDPQAPPSEGAGMPPPSAIDICNNPHHAQRNIALLSATAPGPAAEFIAGGLDQGGEIFLAILEAEGERELLPAEQEFLIAEGIAETRLVLAGTDIPIRIGAHGRAKVELRARDESGQRIRLKLEPEELVPVVIHIEDPDEEPGVFRAYDVVQSGPEGELIGALRVVAVATERRKRAAS